MFGCRQNRHSFGHAQFDRALHIFQDELGFDRECIRLMFFDQKNQTVVNDQVAFGERHGTGRANAAKIDGLYLRSVMFDEAIAGDESARIDAKYDHMQRCTRKFSVCTESASLSVIILAALISKRQNICHVQENHRSIAQLDWGFCNGDAGIDRFAPPFS